ncbi:RANGAP1 [Branchiostoma lanceolatum]|uniref:Ran GTPase-activating protein 1 n=1 Tax=Branchiostoma lanceolatum TaxID=7740 RepID=A0A8K0ES98_BRALA|nr:RANGAP1 [Branchiostoma lanceolatum]
MAEPGVAEVADLLAKTKVEQVNEVSFKGRGLKLDKAEDAAEIVQAVEECKDLQALRLEGNTVGVEAARVIAAALEKHPEFERALWSDMFTGRLRSEIPPSLESLGGAVISANAHLVELDLSDNAFGPDGVKACRGLLTSKAVYTLEMLKLNNNGLGVGGGQILSEALIECHTASSAEGKPLALKVFISGRNRLENPGAKALSKAFKIIGTLEEVSMPQNGIQHQGITALAEAFSENKNLRVVNLNDNIFTEKGAESMAKALPNMTNVEVINFGDCLLRSGGAEAIAKVISSNQHLKELILSYNEIRKDAAISVAEAVEGKEHLKKLDLNGNQLGEEGIEELSGTLEAFDMVDVLASLSDDEGDDIDDENDEEGVGEMTLMMRRDDDEGDDIDDEDDEEGVGEMTLMMRREYIDDEGDDIDDEDDEEGVGEEEEEEGEAVDDPELQVRGTAITPTRENQSPLKLPGNRGRGRPKKSWIECVKKDIKECGLTNVDLLDRVAWKRCVKTGRLLPTPASGNPAAVTYTAKQFLDSPSADRLLGLGKDRPQLLVNELGDSLDDADCAAKSLMKVASIVTDDTTVKSAAFQCADAILTRSLQSKDSQPPLIANSLLVHMGLLKSEEKVQPVRDLQGPLILLQHIFQQVYFPRSLAQLFIAFLTSGLLGTAGTKQSAGETCPPSASDSTDLTSDVMFYYRPYIRRDVLLQTLHQM